MSSIARALLYAAGIVFGSAAISLMHHWGLTWGQSLAVVACFFVGNALWNVARGAGREHAARKA